MAIWLCGDYVAKFQQNKISKVPNIYFSMLEVPTITTHNFKKSGTDVSHFFFIFSKLQEEYLPKCVHIFLDCLK